MRSIVQHQRYEGTNARRPTSRRAMSLVESVVSMVIVGVVVIAAVSTVGASRFMQAKNTDQNKGYLAAQELLNEIMRQSYADPQAGASSFGLESGESTAHRKDFDDVDDYDNLNEAPPRTRDGADIASLKHWRQTVDVAWVAAADMKTPVGSNEGYKRIVVTLSHNGVPAAELVGIRSQGLPELQACCRAGNCDEISAADCTALGGSPKGVNSHCWTTDCTLFDVLMVVTDPSNPRSEETMRCDLFKSWNLGVRLIDDNAAKSEYDEAVTTTQVAFLSVEVDETVIGNKLSGASIGVVFEDPDLGDEFYICSSWTAKDRVTLRLVNTSHYITSSFSTTDINLFTGVQPVSIYRSGLALGAVQLGSYLDTGSTYVASLIVVNTGGVLNNLAISPARRVRLPWGRSGFSFSQLNANGRTMLLRSLVWAANLEANEGLEGVLAPALEPLGL